MCMYACVCACVCVARACVAIQASRVLFSFGHHPDKLRALEMMEPVIVFSCFFFTR